MLRLLTALAAVVLVTAAVSGQQPIRLVVIVVLDQFRADYLTTFASHWRDGFRTLLAEGAVFTRAAYPYLHTDTCAGQRDSSSQATSDPATTPTSIDGTRRFHGPQATMTSSVIAVSGRTKAHMTPLKSGSTS